ncbi:MAG: DUF4442 domain-containing protein [Bacteroidetes bacterium]|nr:DUF4442 domain-containing protein [Bacteroidota bacterium]
MNAGVASFVRMIKHPVKFRLFLLTKLPSAYFSGVRVKEVNETRCEVRVPYKWFSKNPFHSIYFACLSMAAEMSTGALAMLHLYKRKQVLSMLVLKVESEYFKKAVDTTRFICEDGQKILETIEQAIKTNEAKIVRVKSVGMNKSDEIIAEFFITWSFKMKKA